MFNKKFLGILQLDTRMDSNYSREKNKVKGGVQWFIQKKEKERKIFYHLT